MRSFDQFLTVLSEIPDPRRAEGKLYKLPYVLLFSILAVVTGGNSFRSIETFIKVHRRRLNAAFGLHWKRAPAHTAIRYILQGLDPQAVEQVFRRHAVGLRDTAADPVQRTIALDGKTLRRSFDNFNDRKAAQLLHAFDTEAGLVLAHIDIVEKSNEIPAAQQLLGELQVAHCIVTLDAMHCQKNLRGRRTGAGAPDRSTEGQSALPAAKCRNRLRVPPSRQQRHHGHLRTRPT
jgi:hypothetical protein